MKSLKAPSCLVVIAMTRNVYFLNYTNSIVELQIKIVGLNPFSKVKILTNNSILNTQIVFGRGFRFRFSSWVFLQETIKGLKITLNTFPMIGHYVTIINITYFSFYNTTHATIKLASKTCSILQFPLLSSSSSLKIYSLYIH